MRQLKSCGVLVVRGDPVESYLLMVHPTRYDLPKGHIDAGESEQECALRELEEETGIGAHDIALDPDFRFTTNYRVWPRKFGNAECNKTLVVFLGRLLREVPIEPSEHNGYEWRCWNPPHRVQAETIDPLLEHAERFLAGRR
jgi:8-oxo-dGTP pyrophosphatase MutT (NUDIX family)